MPRARWLHDWSQAAPPMRLRIGPQALTRLSPLGALKDEDGHLLWQLHVERAAPGRPTR
jgi:hypothetical protein